MTMEFPQDQERLIARLAAVNPRTAVVLINGSPMELGGWIDKVPAIVEAWYPGMEGGTAVAGILYGEADPAGRLPFTWPKKLEDSPSHRLATQDLDTVNYEEELMVGYRYFDTQEVEPQFPFGYGLSYTTFRYGRLRVSEKNSKVRGRIEIRNTGDRDGSQTVQIYVRPERPSVTRPVHELKAFEKLFLRAWGTPARWSHPSGAGILLLLRDRRPAGSKIPDLTPSKPLHQAATSARLHRSI